MDDQQILLDTQKFHGHKCWASTVGVRAGLAALRALGVERSPGTQLYGIIEIGDEHAAMCFGDGIQYTTGCTFGKGNIRKQAYGKLAITLIEKASGRCGTASRTSRRSSNRSAPRPSCRSAPRASTPTRFLKQKCWSRSI